MSLKFKSAAHVAAAVLLGLLLLAVGVDGVITGRMSHRGYHASGFFAGRAYGCAFIFAGLAWLRAVWMATRHPSFDPEDSTLLFFVLLAGLCVASTLPLLFLDIAF